ncbi:CsbD family protein [Novosphingobium sp.]|uniref:CsbD family protein n=1 Tax=Novosphingobium sp. TaxID=1874826 RepID=UPI00260B3F72|nr:CsbD family protein [Novosphingobium sp.]
MGSTSDRIAGAANSVAGKIKETIGKETGDASLAAEGAAQDVKGKVQTAVGKGKAALGK